MTENSNDWAAGEVVAYLSGSYSRYEAATIDRVYANGIAVIGTQRFSRCGPQGVAYATGDGWLKSSIRKMTPKLAAEVRDTRKLKLLTKIGEYLRSNQNPDLIQEPMLSTLKTILEEDAKRLALKKEGT